MAVPKVHYKTRGVKMDCFFLARRPFLQFNRVSMRHAKHVECGQRRKQREEDLASK